MEAKNGFSTVQLLRLSAQGSSAGDRVQRIRDAQYSYFFLIAIYFTFSFVDKKEFFNMAIFPGFTSTFFRQF